MPSWNTFSSRDTTEDGQTSSVCRHYCLQSLIPILFPPSYSSNQLLHVAHRWLCGLCRLITIHIYPLYATPYDLIIPFVPISQLNISFVISDSFTPAVPHNAYFSLPSNYCDSYLPSFLLPNRPLYNLPRTIHSMDDSLFWSFWKGNVSYNLQVLRPVNSCLLFPYILSYFICLWLAD